MIIHSDADVADDLANSFRCGTLGPWQSVSTTFWDFDKDAEMYKSSIVPKNNRNEVEIASPFFLLSSLPKTSNKVSQTKLL